MPAENRYFVGMDIGGTNIRIALMNGKGELIGPIRRFKFIKGSSAMEEAENNICLPISRLLAENKVNGNEVSGLGLSLAALFERDSGNIVKWPNNRLWDMFPLKSYLEERLGMPVAMEDDANAAALGEHLMGAGKGYGDFAYVTVSTGIGCGLILNNSLYTGPNGWAGEIGHIQVSGEGPSCTCGAKGCLQALVSGPALYKKYLEETTADAGFAAENLEQVVQLAEKGDNTAVRVFEFAAEHLARMFSNMIMLLDLPLVVLGGGVSRAGDVLFRPLRGKLESLLMQSGRKAAIEPAALGDDSGVTGALKIIYGRHRRDS